MVRRSAADTNFIRIRGKSGHLKAACWLTASGQRRKPSLKDSATEIIPPRKR